LAEIVAEDVLEELVLDASADVVAWLAEDATLEPSNDWTVFME
jgi:hypothetical protein